MTACFLLQSLHSLLRFYKTLKSHFFFLLKIYFPPRNSFFSIFRIRMCSEVLRSYVIEDVSDWFECRHMMDSASTLYLSPRAAFRDPCDIFTSFTPSGFTQHMPPCETCRLSGTVFQLHPETSFDIRGLPFHMPQTLLLVFFSWIENKNVIIFINHHSFGVSISPNPVRMQTSTKY